MDEKLPTQIHPSKICTYTVYAYMHNMYPNIHKDYTIHTAPQDIAIDDTTSSKIPGR